MLRSDPAGGEKDDFVFRGKQSCCSNGSRGLPIRIDKSPRMELQSRVEYDKAHCTHIGSGMMAICSQLRAMYRDYFQFQHSIRRARF
jgi:hypothetical protein